MSSSDEAPKETRKRKRRRSLRVPVDEVPRPTQSPGGELASEEVELLGGATMEIPAYTEEGRTTLEEMEADALADLGDDVLGAPRLDGSPEPLDEAPTTVREPPSERSTPEVDRGAIDDEAETLDAPIRSDVFGAGPSVEVDLDAELPESGETRIPQRSEPPEEAAEDEARAIEAPDEDEEPAEAEPAPRAPVVGVIVQRVVAVASSSTSPPPPEEDDEDEPLAAAFRAGVDTAVDTGFDTVPGGELAVDVDADLDEPDVMLDEGDDGGADLEELDVDLEEGAAAAAELSEQEADALLEDEEGEELAPGETSKRASKPPPPPPNDKKAHAPPPPPSGEAAAEPKPKTKPAPAAAKQRKKPRKRWWEELFNDDYLRTVPIPHPKTISRQCDFIEQRFGLAQGATILDVGCGLGLHAVELTRRGYLVVGLDLSLPMLSRAADEAQDHGFKINFLHADMRQMNFDGAFDAVLCWGTTLGYFDDETNKGVVERLYRALKPRGLLLLDVVNRDYVVRGQPNLVWFEGDGCVVMEETQVNYITSRLEVKRNVILDDGRQRDSVYSLRLYSLHELGQILHLQGFRVVEVTGREAHPGVFFGADSPKLLIMAERRPQGPPTPPGRTPSTEMNALDSGEAGAATPSEPAPHDEEPANEAVAAAEPSADVSDALAATLESSEELDLGEELDPDELEAEDLDGAGSDRRSS